MNSAQLAEECGVSRRTIFRDLRTLQESGIPIHYDTVREGYSLPQRIFVPSLDFTLNEALSLAVLCTTLCDPHKGIPFQREACSAAHKLLSNLPGKIRDVLGNVLPGISVELEPHNPLEGAEAIYDLLTQSLARSLQVRIRYQSLMPDEPEEFSTLLSPYRLFFGRRSWYVIGRSSLHRQVRTFNLGRIRRAELVDSRYTIPKRFTLDRFLGNAWFLIRDRTQRCNVVVRFQPLVAKNVAEVAWHKTQKLVWRKDGSLDFHVSVDGLREIQWWILAYADQAEVIRPPLLRRQVQQRVENLYRIYQPKAAPSRATSRRHSKKTRRPKTSSPAKGTSRRPASGKRPAP